MFEITYNGLIEFLTASLKIKNPQRDNRTNDMSEEGTHFQRINGYKRNKEIKKISKALKSYFMMSIRNSRYAEMFFGYFQYFFKNDLFLIKIEDIEGEINLRAPGNLYKLMVNIFLNFRKMKLIKNVQLLKEFSKT